MDQIRQWFIECREVEDNFRKFEGVKMQGLKIFTIVHTYMTSIGAIFASISEVGEVEYIFHIFFFGRGISKN